MKTLPTFHTPQILHDFNSITFPNSKGRSRWRDGGSVSGKGSQIPESEPKKSIAE